MGRIWELVTSRTLALVLLALVLGFLIAGSLLPAPQFMSAEEIDRALNEYPLLFKLGQRFNSQRMAQGYLFGFVGVFLIISTAMCSIDRILTHSRERKAQRRVVSFPEGEAVLQRCLSVRLSGPDMDSLRLRAMEWLRKARFKVLEGRGDDGAVVLAGSRGEAGFWGSVFFHLILISALFGVVMTQLGGFHGSLVFMEGQAYRLSRESFKFIKKDPLLGLRLPEVELGLIKQYSIYHPQDPWYPLEYVARFRVRDMEHGRTRDVDVRINDPLVIEGREFLLTKGGFSPRIRIDSQEGGEIMDAYVSLYSDGGVLDGITLKSEEMSVIIRVYPDYEMRDGEHATRGPELKNPFVNLRIVKGGALIHDGVIRRGGAASAGGYTFAFEDIRPWVMLELTHEPGVEMFFILCFFGLLGLALRVLDPDERMYIRIRPEGDVVVVMALPLSKHFSGIITERAGVFMDALGQEGGGGDIV